VQVVEERQPYFCYKEKKNIMCVKGFLEKIPHYFYFAAWQYEAPGPRSTGKGADQGKKHPKELLK